MPEDPTLDAAIATLLSTLYALRSDVLMRPMYLQSRMDLVVEALPMYPEQFFYVFNYAEGGIAIARGFEEVLGYSSAEVDVEKLYRLVHPEDLPIVSALSRIAIEKMATLRDLKDLFELSLTLDYRMRKACGEYTRILRQTTTYEVDEGSGKVISSLSLCTDIGSIKNSNTIGWQLKGRLADTLDLRPLARFMNRLQYLPSPRELEVIRKLAEGLASKQIAEDLFISTLTVNTHRRNLLERTGARNVAELMRMASQQGWV